MTISGPSLHKEIEEGDESTEVSFSAGRFCRHCPLDITQVVLSSDGDNEQTMRHLEPRRKH